MLRRSFMLALSLAFLSACLARNSARGQSPAPFVVVSFSGYDALTDDLDALGQIVGQPQITTALDSLIKSQARQGLDGVDTKRPWCFVADFPGAKLQALLFVPIVDLGAMLESFEGLFGSPQDLPHDIKQIKVAGNAAYVKQMGDWAVFGVNAESLEETPDPLALLGDLPRDFDLALQLNPQAAPSALRDQFVKLAGNALLPVMRQAAGETVEQYKSRVEMTRQQQAQFATFVGELDRLHVGWQFDRESNSANLDLRISGVEGSALAAGSAMTLLPSKFSGFAAADAPFALSISYALDPKFIAEGISAIAPARERAMAQVAALPARVRPMFEKFNDVVLEALEATLQAGRLDAAVSLKGEGPFTLVAAAAVADAAKIDDQFRKSIESLQPQRLLPKLKLDADAHRGIAFHSAVLPAAANDDAPFLTAIFGPGELPIAFGFGGEGVYFALGPDALAALKASIDDSGTPSAAAEGAMRLALTPLLKAAARQDQDQAILSALITALAGGEDRINVKLRMLPRGYGYRIEMEEGVVRMLGALVAGAPDADR